MTAPLPDIIALFPLPGAILLPDSILPLHIFEPRYRQMVEDCLAELPYIGMIQPQGDDPTHLYRIGCLGKMESHRQLPNGNYLIRLQGESRFEIEEEIATNKLYRKARITYANFLHDIQENEVTLEKEPLYETFQNYLQQRSMDIAWEKIETIPIHHLVNILSMNLEFSYSEKQTLLESYDIATRWHDLITLLEMASFPNNPGNLSGGMIN